VSNFNPFQQGKPNQNPAYAQNAYPGSIIPPSGMYNVGATLTQSFINGSMKKQNNYMIDGVTMDFTTFINTLYPEDCAEKTFMILKLKKE